MACTLFVRRALDVEDPLELVGFPTRQHDMCVTQLMYCMFECVAQAGVARKF
jgi:hypothetical protein